MSDSIDKYLRLLSPEAHCITAAITMAAEKLSVSESTVHRWRRENKVNTADSVLKIILLINTNPEMADDSKKKLGLRDIAIICNLDGKFR